MQIIGSGQIVTLVTSVVPAFFSCIALFICFFCLALLLLLLYSLECAGGFRSCGSDHGLCPLDSHKPLIKAKPVFAAAQTFLRKASRLDRNFKCFGAVTFVPYFRRGCFVSVRTKFGRVPPKKIKTAPHETLLFRTMLLFLLLSFYLRKLLLLRRYSFLRYMSLRHQTGVCLRVPGSLEGFHRRFLLQ